MSTIDLVAFDQPASTGTFEVPVGAGIDGAAALLLWCNGRTGSGLAVNATRGIGFAAAAAQQCYSATAMMDGRSLDFGSQKYVGRRRSSSSCLGWISVGTDGTQTVGLELEFVSFTALGVQLNCTTTDGVARKIRGLLIGGDVDAAVGSFVTETSFPSTTVVSGLSFTPSLVLLMSPGLLDAHLYDQIAHIQLGARATIGALTTMSSVVHGTVNGVFTDTSQYKITETLHITATATTMRARVTAFNADGFTLTWDQNNGSVYRHYYLALGGVSASIPSSETSSIPGAQIVGTSGVTPQAVLLTSSRPIGAGGLRPHARFTIGAAVSASSQCSQFMGATDAVSSTQTRDDHSDTYLGRMITEPSTVNHEVSYLSSTVGSFTVNWVTVSSTTRLIDYLAMSAPELPEADMAKVGKARAIRALIQRLKTINGVGGGYFHDLGGRVYSVLLTPEQAAEGKLPYVCVPLVDESERVVEHDDTFVESRWTMRIWAFIAERSIGGRLHGEAALDAGEMRDDIFRCLMTDLLLDNEVREVRIQRINSVAGVGAGEPFYAEVVIEVELAQWFQRENLGPGGS